MVCLVFFSEGKIPSWSKRMGLWEGFSFVISFYSTVAVLFLVVPGRMWKGVFNNLPNWHFEAMQQTTLESPYSTKSTVWEFISFLCLHTLVKQTYSQNWLLVLSSLGFYSPTFLYDNYWSAGAAAFAVGLFLSILLYIKGNWPNHVCAPKITQHLKVSDNSWTCVMYSRNRGRKRSVQILYKKKRSCSSWVTSLIRE